MSPQWVDLSKPLFPGMPHAKPHGEFEHRIDSNCREPRSGNCCHYRAAGRDREQSAVLAGDLTPKKSLDGLGIQELKLRHSTMSVPGRMQRSLDDHRRLFTAYRENDSVLASALSQSIVLCKQSLNPQLLPDNAFTGHGTSPDCKPASHPAPTSRWSV